MSLVKRSKFWWYDFTIRGVRFQGSTLQTNKNLARQVEAKIRSDKALELFGLGTPKIAPTLAEFLEGAFLSHVTQHAKAKGTLRCNANNVKRLVNWKWKDTRLTAIDGELINRYCASRATQVQVSTLNGELATLRKALRLAEEWKLIPKAPKVRLLPAAKGREFVVSGELERAYLNAASYPLREAAILILDCGIRPEEAVRLTKADVTSNELIVRGGKSANAARALPLTQRAKHAIDLLCALWPDSVWLFPGRKGKHLHRGSLDNMHGKLRKVLADRAAALMAADAAWVAIHTALTTLEFVLYSFRHSYATRLAESGADPFHMQKLLGHHDIRMTQRYVHIQPEGLSLTVKRMEEFGKMLRGEMDTTGTAKAATGTLIRKENA